MQTKHIFEADKYEEIIKNHNLNESVTAKRIFNNTPSSPFPQSFVTIEIQIEKKDFEEMIIPTQQILRILLEYKESKQPIPLLEKLKLLNSLPKRDFVPYSFQKLLCYGSSLIV